MLMDNKGGLSSVPGENGAILTPPENTPSGEMDNFEDFLNQENPQTSGEASPLNPEADTIVGEISGEQQSNAMPVATPIVMDDETEEEASPEVEDLQKIAIQRDAEQLPKEYVNGIAKIIKKDKEDPHKMSLDLDIARWDLMSKAFNRRRGDGLNGSGANGN